VFADAALFVRADVELNGRGQQKKSVQKDAIKKMDRD
jgi:hypothetical protein